MKMKTTKIAGGFQTVIEPDRPAAADGQRYTLLYETDTGCAEADTQARGISEAIRNFRRDVPDEYHGADAYITDEDGCEYPMDW